MLTVTGYITGDPQPKEGDYGRYAEISIRWKTANGKQTHYANARVYGKKIDVVCKYIHDGDQVTISGAVQSIVVKQRKDDQSNYCQIYMDCSEFSIPPKSGGDTTGRPPTISRVDQQEEDIPF